MDGLHSSSKQARSQANQAPNTEHDETLPRRFGRLTLLERLARGGMGEVYLAAAGAIEGAERPCVVKLIRKEHEHDRSFVARFLDEARIQSQLQHPGVAQIVEADVDAEGRPYVVVELVEGRNLGELRARAAQLGVRLGWSECVALAVAFAEALAHVHERTDANGRPLGIVHRDLSPQNVMVGYGGDVKLIDFGTARGENRHCQTVAGIVYAKPGYVAPEVANGQHPDIPADLYAFGVMLWELLAGRRFLEGDAAEHLIAVGRGERNPAPIASLLGAPRELDHVLARMTAPDLAQRYGSARLLVSDLVALLKRAPSLADGERGVRARIAQLMGRLYPSEPTRTRSRFQRLVAEARRRPAPPLLLPASPEPAPVAAELSPPSVETQQLIDALAEEAAVAAAPAAPAYTQLDELLLEDEPMSVEAEALEEDALVADAPVVDAAAEPQQAEPTVVVAAEAAPLSERGAQLSDRAAQLEPSAAPIGSDSERSPQGPVLPGTRYRLLGELGRGGMGIVYRAWDERRKERVALKVLSRERSRQPELVARLRAEAQAIASLDHPNLVRLFDAGEAATGQPFLAMELLDGQSLDTLLAERQALPWAEVLELGVQLCAALETAHAAGIIHRDVKPANLMLTGEGTLKLLDFGIARGKWVKEGEGAACGGFTLIGTPEYMAPEAVSGTPADERGDIYGAGVVLYELLTGYLPHIAPTTVELLDAKVHQEPKAPRDRAPERNIPTFVDRLVRRCLARNPRDRFASAGDLKKALVSALGEPARRKRNRRYLAIGGSTLAVGLATFLTVLGVTRPELRLSPTSGAASVANVEANAEQRSGTTPAPSVERASGAAATGDAPDELPAEELAAGDDDSDEAPANVAPAGSAKGAAADAPDEAPAASAKVADAKAPDAKAAVGSTAPAGSAANTDPERAKIDQALAEAEALMAQKQRVKGFNKLRRLARRYMKTPYASVVFRAYHEAATNMQAWGEAHRVAKLWASVDKSLDAQLTLARMQRAVGKKDAAVESIKRVLEQFPDSNEAKGLLRTLTAPAAPVARR